MMDDIPAEHVQVVDNEAGQVTADCLHNAVIVRKIFENFSNPELLKLSCVNKLWNYEARSLMRNRGNVMARIPSHYDHSFQQDFEAFGVHLRQMNVVPYSGITMVIYANGSTGPSAAQELAYEAIIARLTLKHLSIRLLWGWWEDRDCPEMLVVKKLLQDFSGVLEHLTLAIPGKRAKFFKHFVRDCSFLGLKVLLLKDRDDTTEEVYARYMKALASRAPNLQEFHTSGRINLMVNALKGSKAVLVHHEEVYAPFDQISDSVIHALRLKNLVLEYTDPSSNWERCIRITPMLLQTSCTTLSTISVDAVLAIPLMCSGICFENVHRLVMVIHKSQFERDEPRILSIVKNFDFTRIVPNVNKVEIACHHPPEFSRNHLNAVIEQADAVLGEPKPDRAVNIKELYVDSWDFSSATLPFFAEMFPNIEKLEMVHRFTVVAAAYQETPFGSIWKHWPDLKELDAAAGMLQNTGNLDSVFCGIFPEEVAELRGKDEEYLKTVHIVPVMPAVTCLKNLKALTLNRNNGSSVEPYVDDGTFMFSKVTGFIAFKRHPELAVNLNFRTVQYCNAVVPVPPTSHLKRFASVGTW